MIRKPQKPLSILIIDPTLCHSGEVKELYIDKGHTVQYLNLEGFEYDVLIGEKAWRCPWRSIPEKILRASLTLILAGVRAIKYPKEPS